MPQSAQWLGAVRDTIGFACMPITHPPSWPRLMSVSWLQLLQYQAGI
jgi:hypothetical protein